MQKNVKGYNVICLLNKTSVIQKINELTKHSNMWVQDGIQIAHPFNDTIIVTQKIFDRDVNTGEIKRNDEYIFNYRFITLYESTFLGGFIESAKAELYLANVSDNMDTLHQKSQIQMIDWLGVIRYNEKDKQFVIGDKKWLSSLYEFLGGQNGENKTENK